VKLHRGPMLYKGVTGQQQQQQLELNLFCTKKLHAECNIKNNTPITLFKFLDHEYIAYSTYAKVLNLFIPPKAEKPTLFEISIQRPTECKI
jgi:hypothetical protein